MAAYLNILLLSVLCIGYLQADDEITVEIADGKIKGRSQVTINNVTFYSFQGIPYAQPPINELRFQAPVPAQPWDDVLDATREGNICYQIINAVNESEDCLFINVFTPVEPGSESALPVMFFLHAGAFVAGSSRENNYGPNHFMEYGVILVTINYRLGPFGFFSTGDDAIPGNAGLKDQNLALKWVQKNIPSFGGDPNNVTIVGHSSGAASVGYHILSPLSAGLFKGGIALSGSPLSAFAYQRDQVNITYQTAGYINPNIVNASSRELLEYLQNVPAKDIDDASFKQFSTETPDNQQSLQGFFYAPVIEHKHEGAFLTERMFELLQNGNFSKVPLLLGFTSEEAYLYFTPALQDRLRTAFDENNERLIPHGMHVTNALNRTQTAKEIKKIYGGNSTFAENTTELVKYFSDQIFIRSTIKHATLQSAFTDVYLYQFSYSGILGGFANESATGFSENVRHGEEISYLFRRTINGRDNTDITQYPEQDQIVFKRFITFLTNFAKTLNPTPYEDDLLEDIRWPKIRGLPLEYLDIGSSSEIKIRPRYPYYHTWEEIFETFGVPPFENY